MRYYPIHLDLQQRPVLVVGGGAIAEGKIETLLAAGALVTVISPTLTPRLQEWQTQRRIAWQAREFVEDDLADKPLVISATNDAAVNERVAHAAAACGLLYNTVDQPALCNFITPALVVRGDLTIAISTAGGSPSVAQFVKREISAAIGEEYGELLQLAAWLRGELKARGASYDERRNLLDAFLASDVVGLLRTGSLEAAERRAVEVLTKYVSMKPGEMIIQPQVL